MSYEADNKIEKKKQIKSSVKRFFKKLKIQKRNMWRL